MELEARNATQLSYLILRFSHIGFHGVDSTAQNHALFNTLNPLTWCDHSFILDSLDQRVNLSRHEEYIVPDNFSILLSI